MADASQQNPEEQSSSSPFGNSAYEQEDRRPNGTVMDVTDDDSPIPPGVIPDGDGDAQGAARKEEQQSDAEVPDFFKKMREEEDSSEPDSGQAAPSGEVDDAEAQLAESLFDVMVEEYDLPDLPKEQRPKNTQEFFGLMKHVMDINSTPKYAHPESERFDQYIRQGGDPYNYIRSASQASYGDINVESRQGQVYAVAELLKLQGSTPEMINRRIESFEKAGTLQAEAQDAAGILKSYQEQQRTMLMQQQQQQQQNAIMQEREMQGYMAQALQETNEMLGIPLTTKAKRELWDYMFRPDQNGYTQFMIDYSADPRNIIAAAMMCRYGNSAGRESSRIQQKTAIQRFKDQIARQNIRPKGQSRAARQQGRNTGGGFDMSIFRKATGAK